MRNPVTAADSAPSAHRWRRALVFTAVWTALVGLVLAGLRTEHDRAELAEAQRTARNGLQKNLQFFQWAAALDRLVSPDNSSLRAESSLRHGSLTLPDLPGETPVRMPALGDDPNGLQSHLTSLHPLR